MKRAQAGFSLIEVLLSVVIISVLTGLSLPVFNSFQTRSDLDMTAQQIASALRRGQVYSRGNSGNSQWGVHVTSTDVTLFKGATYAGRDTAYDEATAVPANISTTIPSDIMFSVPAGTPTASASMTLTSNTNETRTITINAKGMVNY